MRRFYCNSFSFDHLESENWTWSAYEQRKHAYWVEYVLTFFPASDVSVNNCLDMTPLRNKCFAGYFISEEIIILYLPLVARDADGAIVRPLPRAKRMLSEATCLPHLVQVYGLDMSNTYSFTSCRLYFQHQNFPTVFHKFSVNLVEMICCLLSCSGSLIVSQ